MSSNSRKKLFRIDMLIAGTAYIRATDEAKAAKLVKWLSQRQLIVAGDLISDRRFDDPLLPDVSLSPAMTIHGPFRGEDGDEATLADVVEES